MKILNADSKTIKEMKRKIKNQSFFTVTIENALINNTRDFDEEIHTDAVIDLVEELKKYPERIESSYTFEDKTIQGNLTKVTVRRK